MLAMSLAQPSMYCINVHVSTYLLFKFIVRLVENCLHIAALKKNFTYLQN